MSLPGRLVELPAGRVFVHQGGSGPPLVLVHGMYVSHFYFRPVIDELARHFSVTAIDLFGFGESDRPPASRFDYGVTAQADLVADVMRELGVARAHVLGHSMGGGVVVALAARHPERVERLVVENGWVYSIVMPTLGKLLLQPLLGPFIFHNLFSRRDLVRHFRSVYKDPALATGELIDYYWERINRAGGRASGLAALRAFASMSEESGLPEKIRAETLVVWGEEDTLFPLPQGERLARAIPGAKLVVVKGCKHSPHEERPDEFLRVVVPFLEGRAAAATDASAAATAR